MSKARAALGQGDPGGALSILDAGPLSPDSRTPGLSARLLAGYAAIHLGDLDRARLELHAAEAVRGDSPRVQLGLCVLSGFGDGSATPCDRAVALSRDMSGCPPLLGRAFVHARAQRGEAARADIAACVSLEPDHDSAARLAGLVPSVEARDVGASRAFAAVVLNDLGGDGANPRAEATEAVRELLAAEQPADALKELDRMEARWGASAALDLLRAQARSEQGDADAARALLVGAAGALAPGSRLALSACVLAGDLEAHAEAERLCAE
ncbi:MAG: hypothetical protein KDA24_25920, partial [Deltaproteobacteria bacterium]|nr:hypothetical protein [Deltaproteobacteria bacterium]